MKDKEIVVNFFQNLLNEYEFELIIDKDSNSEKIFRLNDMQGGNFGNIEQERFSTLADIKERLEAYHQDYIYRSLEEREDTENIPKEDWDLTVKRYLENDTVANILSEIDAETYEKIINEKEKFEIKDMIEILDKDELIYKSICEKYINTMSKEMLLEKNNKILHIFIEDKYIQLKEDGKIDINNYENYLDGSYESYDYDSYQELFNSLIKDEIAYDLNDLALFDENGKWNFYITFEELKKAGYAFMVKDQFPLIEKYAVSEENIFDFFECFSLEQLEDFEQSLNLYFNEKDIVYDEIIGLYSKNNLVFNNDIIRLACGLMTYEDFIENYKDYKPTYFDLSLTKVKNYFEENQIENLMDYGSDGDEGLNKLSSLYKEILDKLNIKYKDIYTEDISDGKYLTTITFEDNTEIELDTSARNGIRVVAKNIESVYATYEKIQDKLKENEKEIDYDYE